MLLFLSVSLAALVGVNSQVLDHIDQVYILDGSCSRVMRPLHSLTLKFVDREDLEDGEFHVPSEDIDCFITFTSDTFSDGISRLVSIKGRNAYHNVSNPHVCESGMTTSDCINSGAFIQIYYGGGANNPSLVLAGTYCGSDTIPYMDAPSQYRSVTVRLVVKAVTITTTQAGSTSGSMSTGATSAAASVTTVAVSAGTTAAGASGSTTVASVSAGSGGTTTQSLVTTIGTQNTTTNDPTISSCGVNFTIDITSFIVGNCHQDGRRNNKDQYYCKDADKCLSRRLQCDGYIANNCGDYEDNLAGKPSFCGKPNIAVDLLWLWILLGILALLALLYWCCWRPGWCVWRMGFLRNCCYNTSCVSCSKKCNTCCCRSCVNAASNKSSNPCGGGGRGGDDGLRARGGDGSRLGGDTGDTGRQQDRHREKQSGKDGAGGLCCCRPSKVKDGGGDYDADGAGGPWEEYFNSGGFHLRRHRF